MAEPDFDLTDRDPATIACLSKTRSSVLNVLVAIGAGIATSGWLIGRHTPEWPLPWGLAETHRRSMIALVVLVAVGYGFIRIGAGREALREPAGRARKFFRARLAAAGVGALAVPLGFAYGWLADARLEAISPFWVAALAIGFMAMPRGHELDDFDEPMGPA